MKILLAYICVSMGRRSKEYAARFVKTYQQFQGGVAHELVVVFNGGKPLLGQEQIFKAIPHGFHERSNTGWDIGGYQDVAERVNHDLLLCFGEATYFHRKGWLLRYAEAFSRFGPGMYGAYSSFLVNPHLNTTSFACSPQFIREYPVMCVSRRDRYEFEHGHRALWRRINAKGLPTKLVTWDGQWDPTDWRKPQNILWRGDQSNCLTWCQHTDRYFQMDAKTKERWALGADGLWQVQKEEHTVMA